MKISLTSPSAWFLLLLFLGTGDGLTPSLALAAAPNPALAKAQKDAEAKGYIFVASHDELVSRAKKEGKLRVIISMSDGPLKHVTEAFRKKYPFLDTRSEGTRGTEVYVRLLQELKAGLTKGIDVNDLQYDHYQEYLPYLKKFDILGMAEQQVLQIPFQMVDPANRNIVAVGSGIQVVAFNRKLHSGRESSQHLGRVSQAGIQRQKIRRRYPAQRCCRSCSRLGP